jgi:hypothetical protein
MELDTSSIEKRFAFGFLQQLLRWMDISQEFIAHLGRKNSLPSFHIICKDPPRALLHPSLPQLVFVKHPSWQTLLGMTAWISREQDRGGSSSASLFWSPTVRITHS